MLKNIKVRDDEKRNAKKKGREGPPNKEGFISKKMELLIKK